MQNNLFEDSVAINDPDSLSGMGPNNMISIGRKSATNLNGSSSVTYVHSYTSHFRLIWSQTQLIAIDYDSLHAFSYQVVNWQFEMLGPAPAVGVAIPPNREYSVLLQQTTQVYNQMLSSKCDKLLAALYQRKQRFDDECARLEAEDQARALEYGVKAQEALNQAQRQAEEQLAALHKDYQQKLVKMYQQLEGQWKQKQQHK